MEIAEKRHSRARIDSRADAAVGAAIAVHRERGPDLLESAGLRVGLLVNVPSLPLRQGLKRLVNRYWTMFLCALLLLSTPSAVDAYA